MNFIELNEEEYINFWEKHPQKTFLSSVETGRYRESLGWKIHFLGVKNKNKIIGATMLVSKKSVLGLSKFYSPRGFLIDYNNKELLEFFTNNIKKYIKKLKGYVLTIDPYIILKERDINGDYVLNGIDNSDVVASLKDLGFINYNKKEDTQVSWMFSLDINNKKEEDIFNQMYTNGRNSIRFAEKFGVNIREIGYSELENFEKIIRETGKRKGFKSHSLSYFQKMYNLYNKKGEIKFLISELNLSKSLSTLKKEKSEKNEELLNTTKKSRINVLNEEIVNLDKKIKELEKIIDEEKKDIITLSCAMFILTKPEVIYLISGNYEKYLKFKSQYLIQWKMIKYGIKHGYKKYNFYGIPKEITSNKNDKDYGIYLFKKNFNGYVEELIGEWELPISFYYKIIKLFKK